MMTSPPLAPPPPPPLSYPHKPHIHFAQGCLLGMKTHDISGGIIAGGEFHAWIGCFMSEPGGGWEHISSEDLVHWHIEQPFRPEQAEAFSAGAVGVDDDGEAFAVVCAVGGPGKLPSPFNIYPFTNRSNNAWAEPTPLFNVYAARQYPGDPPRPWKGVDGRWRALVSFNGCNATTPEHPPEASNCPGGGAAPMWSSPALHGPHADWRYEGVLLLTNETVLNGRDGLPLRPNVHEFVTSDFFPVAGHPSVNAVFITSLYGNSPPLDGTWNYLVAYVGHQPTPGAPLSVHRCVCLDWSAFVRTKGWHGLDAALIDGTTFGIGKSMRSGPPDTGRRVLLAWMNNGFWNGAHDPRTDNDDSLPRDALSLPRDLSFSSKGRLLQRYVPELQSLRRSHEALPPRRLVEEEMWLATRGRQLELFARFEVADAANASFGLQVLAGSYERTVLGIDLADDLAYIDRSLSSGSVPLLPEQADVRAGLLPPRGELTSAKANRTFELHAYIDGPIVTMIVSNETALSVYVYPQRNESIGVAVWASGIVAAASVDVWELASAA